VIHLYAVTLDAPHDLDVTGIERRPVTTVRCGDLYAVVSEHERAPATTEANALAHASVVGAAAARQAALPVRFGIDHVDLAALQQALADAASELRATIARIGDAVEFVVRAAAPLPAPTPVTVPADDVPQRGRSYLEARLADQRAAAAARARVAADLETATDPLAALARTTITIEGHGGPERCFLVARSAADGFAAAGASLVEARDDLVFGGPWPPYTFAQDATMHGGRR
jgi:hypothetical protein